MVFTLINLPNGDVSGWFILGVFLVVVTYVIAFIFCKRNVEKVGAEGRDVIKAVAAQFLIPIGVVLFIFLIIAMLCSSNNKKKKR
jgi:DMSO/TMAO reductase YedYZ heme-binding membrane subunit